MASDLHFNTDSIGIWLRAEKVPSEFGNVVEIWTMPENPDLDPVGTLKAQKIIIIRLYFILVQYVLMV